MPEAAAPAKTDFKPHAFGKFFLLQRLAVGGMAEIYRARVMGAAGFEKELVLKRILPSRSRDQGFIKMLVNEAKLTVQLTHNNIAQIYECGVVEDQFFISMELVNGVSLKEMMTSFATVGAPLSPEQSIFIVLQLLHGLDYAHKKTDPQGQPLRIVHCDISPDNALVSYQGEVKLLDFGIARAATGLSNYKEGMLMGKLGYVAPEQASIEQTWDHRVDIFAAGIILYELLTKQKPFPRATDVESLVASRKARVAPPSALDTRLPRELDPILARALAYDPEKRYSDARAFADELVDLLFPTPHSAIQDLLGRQMRQVFADRIAKQRTARAHDALVMKVLQHIAEQQGQAVRGGDAPEAPAASSIDARPEPAAIRPPVPERTPPRGLSRAQPPKVRIGIPLSRAIVVGFLVAAASAAALFTGETYLRQGVLVVTSTPPGAQVVLDGRPATEPTPAVLEGIMLSQPHAVQVTAPGYKDVAVEVKPELGQLVRRVHAQLRPVIGTLTVESAPPGAEVRLDGKPAGFTPATLNDVRLDERHRIDLLLPGHEIDQFVVLPEQDGLRFTRKLDAVDRKRALARQRPGGAP